VPRPAPPAFLFPVRRTGLLLLSAGTAAVAAAYLALLLGAPAGGWPPWLLAPGASAVLAGLAAIGAAREPRPRRLAVALAVAFAAVPLGLALGLLLPAPTADAPLLLGLPRATTLLLLCTGLIPLLLLPIAYALTFETEILPGSEDGHDGATGGDMRTDAQGGGRDA
jgi:hypothetical protein